jgi:hypothetical protein
VPDFEAYGRAYGQDAKHSFQWLLEPVAGGAYRISNRKLPYYYLSDQLPYLELTQPMGVLGNAHAEWQLLPTN